MKKITLSFVFIIGFVAYAAYQFGGQSSLPESVSQLTNTPTKSVATNTKQTTPVNVPVNNTQQAIPVQPVAVVSKPKGMYVDGEYTGDPADAYYGTVQVKAVVSGGKLTDVVFLQYPSDRSRSASISARAMPILKSEAIQIQNANVNTVSGATEISGAFVQSLSSALSQALN